MYPRQQLIIGKLNVAQSQIYMLIGLFQDMKIPIQSWMNMVS